MNEAGTISPPLAYGVLALSAITVASIIIFSAGLLPSPARPETDDSLPADLYESPAAPLPAGSASSSCSDTWPGYDLPEPQVFPGDDLLCSDIDDYGRRLKAACDSSCVTGSCVLRTTGHTWDCQVGGSDSSRPEAAWVCPGSEWDTCDPPPLSPCESDDTYCDGNSQCDADASLVQEYWPGQPLNYFGVPAGVARGWRVGDRVIVGSDTHTISCIAIGSPDGGETTCGNSPASFDIVVVTGQPSQRYERGTCVEHL